MSVFLLVRKSDGYEAGHQLGKLGYRGVDTVELFLDGVPVDADRLLHADSTLRLRPGWRGPAPPHPRAPTRPDYDQVIQALSGFAARRAETPGESRMVRDGIADKLPAMTVAQAASSALVRHSPHRRRVLDLELDARRCGDRHVADGMMNYTTLDPERALPDPARGSGSRRRPMGHRAFSLATTKQLVNLRRLVGVDDARFDAVSAPMRHAGAAIREASMLLAEMSTEDATAVLSANDVPVAPVVDLDALHLHPQIVAKATD